MYVIYHDLTKRSFKYEEGMKKFKQVTAHECELTTRHYYVNL